MDELTKAILAAAEELRSEYGWTVDDGRGTGHATPDGELVTIMLKHIAILTVSNEINNAIRAKISSLRDEADELKRLVGGT